MVSEFVPKCMEIREGAPEEAPFLFGDVPAIGTCD